MRLIQILLCILIIPFLIISMFQFIHRYTDWQESRVIEQRHLDKIEELEKTRDRLKKYVENFESDDLAQERLVRRFGYIKQGELVYQIDTKKKMADKKDDNKSYLGGLLWSK